MLGYEYFLNRLGIGPTSCSPRCGNSELDPYGTYLEGCDDGGTTAGDGCSSSCTVEDAYTCSRIDNTASNPDTCTHRCGNAALDIFGSYTEACDDGGIIDGDGCTSTCT